MNLGVAGKELRSVLIDKSMRMQLADTHVMVIESSFTVVSSGAVVRLSPEDDPDEAFQPVRALIGQTVIEAIADDRGSLSVVFDNGVRLLAEPDPAYEAWNVSGPDGFLVVCTPGGELATWSARNRSADTERH